jgi:hypothetical protein
MRIRLLSIALWSSAVWAVAPVAGAGPATQPAATTQKAAVHRSHDAPPKDWVQIDSTVGMFEFAVPKKWSQGQKSDQADTFELPAPPPRPVDPKVKTPPPSLNLKPSAFAVTVAKGKGTTLKAAADAARAAFSLETEGNKIDTDQATVLDGRPAWLLVTEEKYVAGSKTFPVAGKPDRVVEIKHPYKTCRIVTVVGDNLYDLSFTADGRRYESGMKVVEQVLGTFAWTGAAADDGGK